MNAVHEIEMLLGVNGHHHTGYITMSDRERIAEIARQLAGIVKTQDTGQGGVGSELPRLFANEDRHSA